MNPMMQYHYYVILNAAYKRFFDKIVVAHGTDGMKYNGRDHSWKRWSLVAHD
jgi:L-asparaginase/Glu-tRNA(Gln) amidotransferase subunit D